MVKKLLTKLRANKLLLAASIVVLVLLIATITFLTMPSKNIIRSAKPDFKALVPPNKELDWKQASPQGGNKDSLAYIYSDDINGVPIRVTQQPLPASFRNSPATSVANMAQSFNATENMQVDGMPVYIGTNAKGPQSVIFTNNDLLILIKSDKQIPDGDWADYIHALSTD